jgi:anaerobic magnesium-protoporphyrin IX monomethyl ester cyclase
VIILINPASTPSPKKPLPMSLLALGALLEDEYDYCIVDGNVEADVEGRVVSIAERRRVTAIGMTVMPGPQLLRAIPLSRTLKRKYPDVPIVWGGYFPSEHAHTVLRDPSIDYCVRGQGERAFASLMRVLTLGGSVRNIPGLSYRDGPRIVDTPLAPLAPLDDLPLWPYARVDMPRYFHRHYLGDRVGAHHTSYGCPHACTFCAVVGIARRRWVAESPERVEHVLRLFKRQYGADAVQFHDMDFFISEARTREIAERVERLEMTWWALGRVDELMRYDARTWETLKRSRLKMVFCGAESASDATLQRMNKGGTSAAAHTLALAARAKAYGIVPEFSFVVGNPPDPADDLAQTLGFIRRLKTINEAAEIILYVYSPVSGAGATQDERRPFAFPETLDEWMSERWRSFALRRNPQTPWAPASVRRKVRNFETVLNAYYPTTTDTRLTPARRRMLRAVSAWRYHSRIEARPVELNALQRVFRYQRPETTGF